MPRSRDLIIKAELKGSKLVVKEARMMERSIRDVGDGGTRASKGIGNLRTGLMGMAAAGGAAAAAVGVLLFKGVQLAENVEETASKYERTLGPAIDKTNEFIAEYSTLLGLSVTEAKELVATNTNIAKSFGLNTDEASDLSIQLLKTAGDLSSFNNVPIEQTTRAITSALVGEREALKTLGIVITEEMVQKQAMLQFSLDSASAITQEQEALATMTLVREKAGIAIGDLMATQDSATNQRRQVQAGIKNLAETLSMRLMPAYQDSLGVVGNIVDELNDWLGINLSDKLKKEQQHLNVLVARITSTNIAQEERNRLIGTLQKDYPDFLENLNAEKVSNQQLTEQLAKLNEQYLKRIRLQVRQESVTEARSELVEDMARLQDMRLKVLNIAQKLNTEEQAGIDITEQSTASILEQIEAYEKGIPEWQHHANYIVGVADPMNNLQTQFEGAKTAVDQQKDAVSDLNEQFRQLQDQLPKIWEEMQNAPTIVVGPADGQSQGGETEGGTIIFDTEIDPRGADAVQPAAVGTPVQSDASGLLVQQPQHQTRLQQLTELMLLEEQMHARRQAFFQAESVAQQKTIKADFQQLQVRRQQIINTNRMAASMGQLVAQQILYAESVQEGIKAIIEGLINQVVAMWIRHAVAAAGLSGPFALFATPALVAAARIAAHAVMDPLLNFGHGGVARGPSHANGGILAMINGKPAYEIEGGEAVINKKATQMFLPELSAINQAGGGVPLAAQGALTLNAMPRRSVNVNARASVNSGAIEAAVQRGIEQGLAKAHIIAEANFSEFDRDYDNFKKYQNRIGNE